MFNYKQKKDFYFKGKGVGQFIFEQCGGYIELVYMWVNHT